ncbi:TetR/AcrR family transcriptional regulator [Microbacterium sp. G2-8]|uniref:TetR/AcrR family transcriptional regulator n=1 Tax=Microbacterium sp. G2-8 TaxID=2842454 RepID=UPI001C89E46A|nr:TetR family transcriptional regulator C-terminal domain-containing protein [Microbacterium sp. G2-8]
MSTASRQRAPRKDPAERAAEIADAARDLALEQGLSAVTLRAVGARIGVASALVAHYSAGMDDLVARAFQQIVSAELADISALLAHTEDPAARMDQLIATTLDGTREDVTLIWVESWILGRRSEPLAAVVRDAMDGWHGLVRGIIDDGLRTSAFAVDDADAAAWQVLGMIDGLNAQGLVRWGESAARVPLLQSAVAGMLARR